VYERIQDEKREATVNANASPLHCVAVDTGLRVSDAVAFQHALVPLFNKKPCPPKKPRVHIMIVRRQQLDKNRIVYEVESLVDNQYFLTEDPLFDAAVNKVAKIVTATVGSSAR